MKVSDAMRLADEMGLPDLRNSFIQERVYAWRGEKPPCCAIGGASVASGSFQFEMYDRVEILTEESERSAHFVRNCGDWERFCMAKCSTVCPAGCPACFALNIPRYSMTQHLYDVHLWSRTQIADWLDSLDAGEVE